ncbi:S-adenosylmethionine decarboxylase proenzyme-like [Schistocerca gregaria]|uniref:S-adenosylmethionine decarboxylase proenzyme-like n=1 Tax=Schistocerca gregaria TaxID=7010 RepID=UPI00211F44EA|nr:S-adenosylmethionine decarboxylase proenzyme-like [Schistocerca gregaria]
MSKETFPVGFEGAEKKIEIRFREDFCNPNGLRAILAAQWQTEILDIIHCNIIRSCTNEVFDSYVLSESSLFVYPFKVILKTCGMTTLLNCLQPLIDLAQAKCNLAPEFVFFSRKNFKFPERQLSPHKSTTEELAVLNKICSGKMHVFGPKNEDHWVMYCARIARPQLAPDRQDKTLEILMEDLDPGVMKQFYRDHPGFISASETTQSSGISYLVAGATTSEVQFDPCGFSLNALSDESYYTIHITPEPECSYVSFETNKHAANYTELIAAVVKVFKPAKFIVTLLTGPYSQLAAPSPNYDSEHLESLGYHTLHALHVYKDDVRDYGLQYASFKANAAMCVPHAANPRIVDTEIVSSPYAVY